MGTLDFGMKFGSYDTLDLIALANNTMQLNHLDHEDMQNLVKELSDRLEVSFHNDMAKKTTSCPVS